MSRTGYLPQRVGMRFNSAELGAWYAAAVLTTAGFEVGHRLRRETVATGVAGIRYQYRCYSTRLAGD